MKKTMMVALVLIFFLAYAALATAGLKEGLWEMKTSVEMPGMTMAMPATTTRTCITKDELVPKPAAQKGQPQECKMKDQTLNGDTVTYAMECTGKGGTTEISGKMTYTGDTMEGSTTIKISGPKPMEMSSKVTGKYIGQCTK
jgi:hypothetical protein